MKKSIHMRVTIIACLMGATVNVHAETVVPPDSLAAMSRISGGDLERAREEGLDMTRLHATPGLHIVPLDESAFVGPMAEQIKHEIAEQSAKGMLTASKRDVHDIRAASRQAPHSKDRFAVFDKVYKSVVDIRPHLYYEPVSVSGTPLEALPLVEATTAGGLKNGRWTGVSRSWEVAGLGFVQLSESEYRESGGSITVIKEWLNADVKGYPATVKTSRAEDGATLVSLGWVTDSTVFRLDLQPIDGDALLANQAALLAIAQGLGGDGLR